MGKRKTPAKPPVLDPNYTPRKCLKCLQMFPSTGVGNRICQPCKTGRQVVGKAIDRYAERKRAESGKVIRKPRNNQGE